MTDDEKRKLFWDTVDAIRERNQDNDSGQIEADVEAAVEEVRCLAMLDESMNDIQAGRTQPAKQAIDEIAAEFNLALERRPAGDVRDRARGEDQAFELPTDPKA